MSVNIHLLLLSSILNILIGLSAGLGIAGVGFIILGVILVVIAIKKSTCCNK